LLALGLPGAPLMKPGSALGFVLAGVAVAARGRPRGGRVHAAQAGLPLLLVSVASLVCVFAWPQSRVAACASPALLSLVFVLVAAASLRFRPGAGAGLSCAVIASLAATAVSCAVILVYAAWWLQSGGRLLLVTLAPQSAVLQTVLSLAVAGRCLGAVPAGGWRRHASLLRVAAVTTLGLVVAWGLILTNSIASIARDVEQRTDSVAQTLLEHMHRSLDPADLILRQVAERITRQGMERFEQSRQEWDELALSATSMRQISALVILDRTGRVVSYSAQFPPALPGSFTYRDYFLAHQRGETTYLGPLIQTAWGQRAFTYSRRVVDREGAFAGVVLATLQVDYFRQFYRSLNLGTGGAVSLFRTDGRQLMREPLPADFATVDARNQALFTQHVPARDSGSFVAVSPFDHAQRFVAYRVSKTLPLVVTASMSAVPLARGFERELFASALLLTLALAVLVKATAQQLRALRRDAEQQAQLEAGRAFTRAILDSVAATVAIVDRGGRVLDANKAWARFAQAQGGDAAAAGEDGAAPNGLEVLRRAGAGDADGVRSVQWGVQAVMRQELPGSEHNYECAGAAGSRWLKVRITPLEGADGRVVISQEDVTDLKLAEVALRQAQAELRQAHEALAVESEARFRHTFEQAAVGMAHVDLDGRFLRVNRRLCQMLQRSAEQLLQLDFTDVTHPADLQADRALVQAVLDGRRDDYALQKRYVRADGTLVWAQLTVSLRRDEGGRPLHFISVVEDIQALKDAELALVQANQVLEQRVAERTRELRDSQRHYQTLIEGSLQGILVERVGDEDVEVLFANDVAARMYGYDDAAQLLAAPRLGPLMPEEVQRQTRHHWERMGRGELDAIHLQVGARRRDGTPFWMELMGRRIDWQGEAVLQVTVMDVTERQRLEAELKRQASIDSLTSLLTRRHFNLVAEQEIRRSQAAPRLLTTLMVDIDHFKRVNDTWGHQAGDLVLTRVAETLKTVLRGSDLVGRFGGEEFVALMVGADEAEGLHAAARLREALRHQEVLHKGQAIRVTASVGISAWRPDEANLEPSLGRADEALYAAKAAGRDCARVYGAGGAGTGGPQRPVPAAVGDTVPAEMDTVQGL
jgi:diguanylate cyclase (GGDEF)-like protein/PAS domain S-box-containing protein